jgi:tryptophan-rich sensory protein
MPPLRTSGLRIMLLGLFGGYVGLALAFGCGAPSRFAGPGFATALSVLPTRGWAVIFGLGAVSLGALWNRRRLLVLQLTAGMFLYLFWASCFALSAYHDKHAGITGPVVWAVIAVANAACASTVYGPSPRRWHL